MAVLLAPGTLCVCRKLAKDHIRQQEKLAETDLPAVNVRLLQRHMELKQVSGEKAKKHCCAWRQGRELKNETFTTQPI